MQWTTWTTVRDGPVSEHPACHMTSAAEDGSMPPCYRFENGIPRGTSSQFSLMCTCKTSSWQSHSHNCRHSAARGGSVGRRPRWSASAPLLSWLRNSWECSCNASRHRWACPGQLQETHSRLSKRATAGDNTQKGGGSGVGRCREGISTQELNVTWG